MTVDPAIRALARVSLRDRPLDDVLQEITDIARSAIPGAEATSVTLMKDDVGFTAAFTGQMALDADELQYDRGYGPCLDAGRTGLVMRVTDMREETRWPDYAAAVTAKGVLSSLSVPLPYQGGTIGALNVYAGEVAAFDDDAVRAGEEFAAYIAVAVANADAHVEAVTLAAQMRQAMDSRAVIDMAKGVIIARNHCTPEEAFRILSQASQNQNRKLRDLAAALISSETGPANAR